MNYGALKTLAKDYLETDETTFNTNLPVFVRLAEEDIYRQVQLPDLKATATSTFTPNDRFLGVPSDFLSAYTLAVVDAAGEYHFLQNKEIDFMREAFPDPTTRNLPRYFALNDDTAFVVAPIPGTDYATELVYFYKPASLSTLGDSGTTWLSENSENAILFGTVMHGYIYLKGDQDVIALYKEKFDNAIADLKLIEEGRNRKSSYRTMDRRTPT